VAALALQLRNMMAAFGLQLPQTACAARESGGGGATVQRDRIECALGCPRPFQKLTSNIFPPLI
jgi:hypothetical protein